MDSNPWNQFNTQLLVTPESYRERETRMRDAARHFYIDSTSYELFVDVTVPLYEYCVDEAGDTSLKVAQELCVPLTVLDLDEPLQSTLVRMRQETQDLLPTEQWSESHHRHLVLRADKDSLVIYDNTNGEPYHVWHTYMRLNAENLARRPRPLYGNLPGSQDSAPIDTRPISIRWELI